MSHRLGRAVVPALMALLTLGTGFCITASAAPGPSAVTRDPDAVLPPPDSVRQFTGVAGLAAATRVGRAKVNITVPVLTVAVYIVPEYRYRQRGNSVFARAARVQLPRRPDPACDYYYSGVFTDIYAVDIDQPDPPRSGRFRSVGRFPDTRVSMLAFGSIPVTATLHLRQTTRNGRPEPMFLDPLSGRVSVPRGGSPLDAGGCDAAWDSSAAQPYLVTGHLDASVSDVRVDGRTIAVGSGCRTETPLRLNLTGESPESGGQYLSADQGGILTQQLNRSTVNPENPIALYPGSSNLTIPSFTGCRSPDGEDVSPLITGMVSGPDNTLAVAQTKPVAGGFDPATPSLCSDFDGCLSTLPDHPRPPAVTR